MGPLERDHRARTIRAAISALYVEHHQLRRAARVMDEVVVDNELSLPGAKTIIGVTGPNLVGKSTFVRQWALQRYRQAVGAEALSNAELPQWSPSSEMDAQFVPVVWVNLGAAAVRGSLALELLAGVGIDLAKAPPSHRAVSRMQWVGTQLVVIDDMHFLRTDKQLGREALDYIKKLNTDLGERGVTLVLVGADLETSQLWEDRQIAGRLHPVPISRFTDATLEQRAEWQRLLKAFEDTILPWFPDSPAAVLSHKTPGLLMRRTHGSIRDLHELLMAAAKCACNDESWAITPELLERVEINESLSQHATAQTAAAQRQRVAVNKARGRAKSATPTRAVKTQ